MLIGELTAATGLGKDTIRYYEKLGLIKAAARRAGTRLYKEFDGETVERLRLIKEAQSLGFTLREIKQLSDNFADESLIPETQKAIIIKQKINELNEKMQQLNQIKQYLTDKLTMLERGKFEFQV